MRRKKARRKLTFDRVSFFVVFLGLPLAIFLLFVVWPFVQAFYYSMTDWSGFTPDMNFVGLRELPEAAPRRHLHDRVLEQHPAGGRGAPGDRRAQLRAGHDGHRGGHHARGRAWDPELQLLPGDLVLPLHDPGDHHRHPVESDVRPVRRPAERHPRQARVRPVRQLPLARGHPHRHAGLDVRDHLGLRGLLHGAVRRSDQGDPVGLLRRDPAGRRRPDPDGGTRSRSR